MKRNVKTSSNKSGFVKKSKASNIIDNIKAMNPLVTGGLVVLFTVIASSIIIFGQGKAQAKTLKLSPEIRKVSGNEPLPEIKGDTPEEAATNAIETGALDHQVPNDTLIDLQKEKPKGTIVPYDVIALDRGGIMAYFICYAGKSFLIVHQRSGKQVGSTRYPEGDATCEDMANGKDAMPSTTQRFNNAK